VSSSVDGLVSGLSTSSLITQLMQVEAAPQTRLKAKVTTAQTAVTAYQSVNAKLASFKTAADDLGQLSTWRGIKATSSSTSVTATALTGTNGAAGTTTFNVKALASSQLTTARVPGTGNIVDADTITVTIGPLDGSMQDDGVTPKDKVVTIDVSKDKTAQGVANALNAAGIGVKAALVSTGTADKVLQLSGVKTGTDNKFTVAGLGTTSTSVNLRDVTQAGNALIQIGGGDNDPGGAGYDVTSTTNTFSGLMPGVSIAVSKVEDNVTVNAAADVTGIADKFQALVDAANATLSEISKQTAFDAATKKSSPLTGDFAVRNMSQRILSSISQGLSYQDPEWVKPDNDPNAKPDMIDFGSLAKLGITLERSGRLNFDATKFKNSYAENQGAVQAAGIGFADQVEKLATDMTNNVKSVITGRTSEIDRFSSQIAEWDVRLSARKLALQKQYSDLEVSLGKLKEKSSWLAGQLG
jgi:flagellar hook-associated protein 2